MDKNTAKHVLPIAQKTAFQIFIFSVHSTSCFPNPLQKQVNETSSCHAIHVPPAQMSTSRCLGVKELSLSLSLPLSLSFSFETNFHT